MIERIRQLEEQSLALEPDVGARAQMLEKVVRYTEEFLNRQPRDPVFCVSDHEGAGLLDSPIAEDPIDIDTAIGLYRENVERPGINPASPWHLGYVPGGGLYHAALGDFLAAVTNRYSGIFLASPGAVRMERMVLGWLGSVFGFPHTMAGDLTSGGSIAHLSGIVAARESRGLKARDFERTVVYLTPQTHHCVEKALGVAGMKECVQRTIALDDHHRMSAAALAAAIKADLAGGLNPWMIVASAGTTDTGAVDPLEAIADIAERYSLWMQVDGAYGGVFALLDYGKRLLRGIERSDAVIVNPHKGLFLPYGSGAILVRDGAALRAAHRYSANYMQDEETLASEDEISPADLSPELTRHFRGLRLWLPLKLLGVAPFRAALEEKLLLARYFYERIQEIDGFEVGPYPDLSIVAFRYVPKRGDANAFNQALVLVLQKDGRTFLSSTNIDGVFMLRVAVLSFRTHLEQIDRTIDILQEKVRELESAKSPQAARDDLPQSVSSTGGTL